MNWKCLIVDDEPPAQRIIERFLNDIPSAKIVGKCKNAFEASEVLMTQEVDIMFLDINMPKMTGLSFIQTLKRPPVIIITTAYREYALDAFELDVIDYLKKPFSFERFFKAFNKAVEKLNNNQPKAIPTIEKLEEPKQEFIFVKEDKVSYKVELNDILFIESVGDYNKIHTPNKVYLTYQTLKKLRELLPEDAFPRVHKSYIISLSKIENIMGNLVKIKGEQIPIGQTYRKAFFELIEKFQ